ncbi:hypothetical protein DSECCO2_652540 [anaerobic digester metagenome]
MIDGTGVDGDGSAIGAAHPAFSKTCVVHEIAIHAGYVHDEGALVAIGQIHGIVIVKPSSTPGCGGTMPNVIDEPASSIYVCGNGGCRCSRIVDLIYTGVPVFQEIIADVIHVRNVAFPIVAQGAPLIRCDAHGSGKPGIGGGSITFIGYTAVNLDRKLICIFSRESPDKDIRVVVSSSYQRKAGITAASAVTQSRYLRGITYQLYESDVTILIVPILDVCL